MVAGLTAGKNMFGVRVNASVFVTLVVVEAPDVVGDSGVMETPGVSGALGIVGDPNVVGTLGETGSPGVA